MRYRHLSAAALVAGALFRSDAIAQSPPAAQRPAACNLPEHSQFDFWVGRWDVRRTGQTTLTARSHIEKVYGGCAIRENWMPVQGGGGGSLNSFLPDQGIWRQTWVDSMNSYAVFEGGFADGAMVLRGKWKGALGPGTEPLVRIRWTKDTDGSVRQRGESSIDEGATWKPFFDLTYGPAVEPN